MATKKTIELPGGITVPEEDYLNYLAQTNGYLDFKDYLRKKAKALEENNGEDKDPVRDAGDRKKIIVHIIRM